MKMRNIYVLILLSWLTFMLISCASSKRTSNTNYAFLYKPVKELNPEFTVYHLNATYSRIYFRIPKKDIAFSKKTVDDDETARIRISTKLFSQNNNYYPIDTSSATFSKYENDVVTINEIPYLIDSFDLKIQVGTDYILQIFFTDLNQSKFYNIPVYVQKSSINNRQQFRCVDESEILMFSYTIKKYDIINIQHNKNPSKLYVRYYNREFPLAAPAFVTTGFQPFNYKADSTFQLEAINNIFQFIPTQEGFYHLQCDSLSDKEGLTFFVFGKNFPEVSTAENLLEPLRFITSKDEYEEIKMAENVKLQVERFWINAGGSAERARELIKKYYGRVYQANLLFTSYKEGWKTDRGMIYLIFGIPNIVHKNTASEVWIYGEEGNIMSLTFTFFKVTNPFTDNDFMLDRSIIYKNNWYRGVESWRQGRVY